MKARKVKALLSAITSLLAVAFLMTTSTFAWFNFNKAQSNSIVTTAGDLKIESFSATALKYVYPTYGSGSSSSSASSASSSSTAPLYNYDGVGTVNSLDVVASTVEMNKYDPFYLYLKNDKVDVLNTNIVLKLAFSVTTYTDATVNIKAIRASTWTGSERITDHLDFWTSDTDYASTASVTYDGTAYTLAGENGTNNVPFYGMKEVERLTHVNSTADYQYFYNSDAAQIPSELSLKTYTVDFASATKNADGGTTFTKTVYVNVDYNQSTLADYSTSLSADATITLGMDYSLEIEAVQE